MVAILVDIVVSFHDYPTVKHHIPYNMLFKEYYFISLIGLIYNQNVNKPKNGGP